MSEDLIKKIHTMCEQPLKEIGISIYHLEFTKEGSDNFLRFFIDKDDSTVDIDVCVEASELLSQILDKNEPISLSYNLEVSSSGAEKPLVKDQHFQQAIGKYVHFDLVEAIDGKFEYEGVLIGFDQDFYELDVTIKTRTKKYRISKNMVISARMAVKF